MSPGDRAEEDDNMVTVISAWTQRGWSGRDHEISDERMAEIIGRDFATVSHAMRAAIARADPEGYAAIEYRVGDEVWRRGAEPNLPGRPAMHKRVR